jgi:hypothetical protein
MSNNRERIGRGLRAAFMEDDEPIQQGGRGGRQNRELAMRGRSDLEPSLFERALERATSAAGGAAKTAVSEAGKMIGTYGMVPIYTLWARIHRPVLLDSDFAMERLHSGEQELYAARELLEEFITDVEPKVFDHLVNRLGPVFADQILAREAAWETKPDRERDVTSMEESRATQTAIRIFKGEPLRKLRKELQDDIYREEVEEILDAMSASLVLLRQERVVQEIKKSMADEITVWNVPWWANIAGSFLTAREMRQSINAAFIPHQGKERGIQILLVRRGVRDYTVVVRRGSRTEEGGSNDLSPNPELQWKESGVYSLVTDSAYGKFFRRFLGLKDVEIGVVEAREPGREGEPVRIPIGIKGEDLSDLEEGPVTLIRDNINLAQDILADLADIEERAQGLFGEIAEGETLKGKLEEHREELEELVMRRMQLEGMPRVNVILHRAQQIARAMRDKQITVEQLKGEAQPEEVVDGALEILARNSVGDRLKAARMEHQPPLKNTKEARGFLEQVGRMLEQHHDSQRVTEQVITRGVEAVKLLRPKKAVKILESQGLNKGQIRHWLLMAGVEREKIDKLVS